MLIAFNIFLLAVDIGILCAAWRATSGWRRAATIAIAPLIVLVASAVTAQGIFAPLRLLACGLFIHGPILAAATSLMASRRRKLREAAAWGAIAVALLGVGIDAFFIEPYWLDVTRLTLRSPKLSRPLRIVALADFQTDTLGPYERDVLERVAAEQPDLILFVGDYLQVPPAAWDDAAAQFRKLLREAKLQPSRGIFAVQGNVDPPQWTELFNDTEVRLFTETTSVELDDLCLTGLSQPDSRDPFLRIPSSDKFHIVFGHHPDYALSKLRADLLLAGHTHGGQVRLPVLGPLLTLSRIPRAWAAGVTPRGEESTLVVSRGTGMERGNAPRLRFLCRPEIVVIDLVPTY